jgi:hypothetical protein
VPQVRFTDTTTNFDQDAWSGICLFAYQGGAHLMPFRGILVLIWLYAVGSGQFGLDFGVTNLPTWGYEYLKSPIRARYLRMGLPEWQLS